MLNIPNIIIPKANVCFEVLHSEFMYLSISRVFFTDDKWSRGYIWCKSDFLCGELTFKFLLVSYF